METHIKTVVFIVLRKNFKLQHGRIADRLMLTNTIDIIYSLFL